MPLNPAAYNVLLLSVQDLINGSYVQPNVDAQTLIPSIKLVQDQYLQPLLGTEFLNQLQTDFVNNALSTNEINLLNIYIKPMMCQYTMMENVFANSFKYTVKGLEQLRSDNSEPASQGTVEAFSERFRSAGDFYAQRLIEYLKFNYLLFPTYNESMVNQGDMLPNRRNAYQGNFNLHPDHRGSRIGRGYYGGRFGIFV